MQDPSDLTHASMIRDSANESRFKVSPGAYFGQMSLNSHESDDRFIERRVAFLALRQAALQQELEELQELRRNQNLARFQQQRPWKPHVPPLRLDIHRQQDIQDPLWPHRYPRTLVTLERRTMREKMQRHQISLAQQNAFLREEDPKFAFDDAQEQLDFSRRELIDFHQRRSFLARQSDAAERQQISLAQQNAFLREEGSKFAFDDAQEQLFFDGRDFLDVNQQNLFPARQSDAVASQQRTHLGTRVTHQSHSLSVHDSHQSVKADFPEYSGSEFLNPRSLIQQAAFQSPFFEAGTEREQAVLRKAYRVILEEPIPQQGLFACNVEERLQHGAFLQVPPSSVSVPPISEQGSSNKRHEDQNSDRFHLPVSLLTHNTKPKEDFQGKSRGMPKDALEEIFSADVQVSATLLKDNMDPQENCLGKNQGTHNHALDEISGPSVSEGISQSNIDDEIKMGQKETKTSMEELSTTNESQEDEVVGLDQKVPERSKTLCQEKVRRAAPRQWDVQWLKNYEMLKQFREQNGHCIVPRYYFPNPHLGHWVADQRKQYRNMVQKTPSSMTTARLEMLEALDFTWHAQKSAWDHHYDSLCKFLAERGHCHISLKDDDEYPQLPLWVKEQRRHYRFYINGKKTRMCKERIEKLNHIGFCFDTAEATWLLRLGELREFKSRFGNCRVPLQWQENPLLGTWVQANRRQYQRGHPSLAQDRVNELNELEFDWVVQENDMKSGEQGGMSKRKQKCHGDENKKPAPLRKQYKKTHPSFPSSCSENYDGCETSIMICQPTLTVSGSLSKINLPQVGSQSSWNREDNNGETNDGSASSDGF